MKKYILFLPWLLLVIIKGCKKAPPTQELVPRLERKTQTMFNGNPYNARKEFAYDDDGKRIKEITAYRMNNAPINKRTSYTYNEAQYRYYINGIEQTRESINHMLNTGGLLTQHENTYYNSRLVYVYNENNYIKKVSYNRMGMPEGYSKYHYKSGNVPDSIEFYKNDNAVNYVSIFECATGKKNSIGNENKGLQLFGKSKASPLTKETRILNNYPGERLQLYIAAFVYNFLVAYQIKESNSFLYFEYQVHAFVLLSAENTASQFFFPGVTFKCSAICKKSE